MTARTDEESLMTAYAAGDAAAFSPLFRSLAAPVHGFFVRWFHNDSAADDLLQTTFIKLHRSRRAYRRGEPLRPWLFTIATRVGLDELRRRKRRPELLDEKRLQAADQTAVEWASCERDIVAEVEREERAACVRRALAQLPWSQRVVIELHRFHGLSFGELARALGTTEAAAKLRAFRGYRRLRRDLAPLLGA